MGTGQQSTAAKKTLNRNRFKALDEQIAATMAWCRERGIVINTEREAYEWFIQRQIEDHGYSTPPQEMAQISAEQVKNEFGLQLFCKRWRHASFPVTRNGKVISLRRFLPWGANGWRDTRAELASAVDLSEDEAFALARGATAAADHLVKQAKQCDTLIGQASVWQELATTPQQLFLTAPSVESDETGEIEDDDDAE